MRSQPISAPVLSAEETEAKIRKDNKGQPQEWVDDKVKDEQARVDAAQAEYDTMPPARAYTPPDNILNKGEE